MNSLQKALGFNALFSALSGLTLLLFHQAVAQLFATDQGRVFWIIGLVLLFFSATILLEMKKQRGLAVLWIITQDLLWVVGSAALLIFQPFGLSGSGQGIK